MHIWLTINETGELDALWNIVHYIIDGMLIIVLFKSSDYFKLFKFCHVNILTIETKQNKIPFLDVNVIRDRINL